MLQGKVHWLDFSALTLSGADFKTINPKYQYFTIAPLILTRV